MGKKIAFIKKKISKLITKKLFYGIEKKFLIKKKNKSRKHMYISEIAVNQENVNVREQLKFEMLCLLYIYTLTQQNKATKKHKHSKTKTKMKLEIV